ncbi:MAG: hypothetical protein RMI91_06190 [Gemmatales bacterium]|nr:hypothetical protein [Gemmatales bacterium]MDW7994225.1 hypothetical protein [Gemmatales bacterium]
MNQYRTLALLGCTLAYCSTAAILFGQAGGYAAKVEKVDPPKELSQAIASVLANEAVRVTDSKGQVLCEIWWRKNVPLAKAPTHPTASYRDMTETTLVGVIRWVQPGSDYRKQKIKPGVYTMRLAYQPEDGDHMGTAPYTEFLLLTPSNLDERAEPLDSAKALHELSANAAGSNHPAVFLLFPGKSVAQAEIRDEGNGHFVLHVVLSAEHGGKTFALPVALTLIGHSSAS